MDLFDPEMGPPLTVTTTLGCSRSRINSNEGVLYTLKISRIIVCKLVAYPGYAF